MAALPRFFGSIRASVDGKNRLSIPRKFRDQLHRDNAGGDKVVLSRWLDGALAIHPATKWEVNCEELGGVRNPDRELRRLRYVLIGTSEELGIDSQSRILLPQSLREHAGITKDVQLVGDFDKILIWDAERWAELADMDDEDLSTQYEEIQDRIARAAQGESPAASAAE